jgi:phosphoglycolate phosphatase
LITDVDNTLFDFGLYAEAGLRAVLPVASQLLALSREQVVAELRHAYRVFNSIEIPYAYELMPSLASRTPDDRHAISQGLATTFWSGASKSMRAYDGVVPTMSYLWRNGTAIVAVSDAPMWEVWRKLRRLRLLRFVAGIVAVGALKRRTGPVLRHHDVPEYRSPYRSRSRFYRTLKDDDRKPSPQAYRYVLEEVTLPSDRVTVVGDSPLKDLMPARELGLAAYWARYGERQRHLELLLQSVTPFEPPEALRSQADAARSFPTLERFDDLESVISFPQARLPF